MSELTTTGAALTTIERLKLLAAKGNSLAQQGEAPVGDTTRNESEVCNEEAGAGAEQQLTPLQKLARLRSPDLKNSHAEQLNKALAKSFTKTGRIASNQASRSELQKLADMTKSKQERAAELQIDETALQRLARLSGQSEFERGKAKFTEDKTIYRDESEMSVGTAKREKVAKATTENVEMLQHRKQVLRNAALKNKTGKVLPIAANFAKEILLEDLSSPIPRNLEGQTLRVAPDKPNQVTTSHTLASGEVTHINNDIARAAGQHLEQQRSSDKWEPAIPFASLDPSQQSAVKLLSSVGRGILIGYAGTGKTTTADNFIVEIEDTIDYEMAGALRHNYEGANALDPIMKVAFCAFTGMATQRLRSKLNPKFQRHNCMTIHKLLGYHPEYYDYINDMGETKTKRVFEPGYDSINPLQWDVIVLDEGGMIPPKLWNELCNSIQPHTRIYMIGDIAQLPPIHGISPMALAMSSWPTAELTTVHRTDNSTLVDEAQKIRLGKRPNFHTPVTAWTELNVYPDIAAQQFLAGIKKLYTEGSYDPHQDTILVPTNMKDLGQMTLNITLRKIFNGDTPATKIDAVRQKPTIAIGDKMMYCNNDDSLGLANGMVGYVVDIEKNARYEGKQTLTETQLLELDFSAATDGDDESPDQMQASHITYVEFPEAFGDNKVIPLSTCGQYANLCHAYATTCHKAQGGEYRQVIVLCHASAGKMLNREWFYTAWTRAQRNVRVVGTSRGLNACLRNQQVKGNTIEEKVEKLLHKHRAKLGKNLPNFPRLIKTWHI